MAKKALTKVIPRIDPDEDFSDVDGDPRTEFALDTDLEDPTRHYCWVRNDPETIGEYRGGPVGYIVERYEAGGVRPKQCSGMDDDGAPITKRDLVLMSCDKAKWEKRQRFEQKQTKENNDRMFKRAQRDVVLAERE